MTKNKFEGVIFPDFKTHYKATVIKIVYVIMNNYLHQKLNNLEEMEKVLETYNSVRMSQEETENLNKPITSKKTESVIKNLPSKKCPR